MSFIHLHVHSEYSILDGFLRIGDLIKRVKEFKMPAVALTDHGGMYGVIPFYKRAKKEGIKPIIGVEMYFSPTSRFDKKGKEDAVNYHILLLAKNFKGYQNLTRLVSIGHLEGFYYKPRIDMEILREHSEGLIVGTSCLKGEIPSLILSGQYERAKKRVYEFKEIFGDDFYIELQNHHLPEEERVIPELLRLAKETDTKYFASNDAHYLKKEDAKAHGILLCIQTQTTISNPDRLKFQTDEFYLKSFEEMWELFKDIPDAIHTTMEIAEKCEVEIPLGKSRLPKFPLPEGEDAFSVLKRKCEDGIEEKFGKETPEIMERLTRELSVIKEMGFSDYFLIVSDFVSFAKRKGIRVGPGRGSAAGSLVSYLLGITEINPLQYNLLFERFLNPQRISLPDIDIDFSDERRDEVIEYVRKKYGEDRVAQIATFGRMEARGVIRDVGRVLGYSAKEMDRIAKLIPFGMNFNDALANEPLLKKEMESDENKRELFELSMKLEGLIRNFSTHAAGIVIGDTPLSDLVPLQFTKDKSVTTQYDKDVLEEMGLLKMDFLGLRTLTVIENALTLINREREENFEIEKIPLDDEKTFSLLREGKTIGVFQLESPGMRRVLTGVKPNTMEDIIAVLSLYRPGTIKSGQVDEFIKRKHGVIDYTSIHPLLDEILKPTYGIIVYQEQVMQVAQKLAGYTLAEADLLRKAMGKKKKDIMAKLRDDFINRCINNGIEKEIAERVFNTIEKFAEYGFNKSHSTAYATISYQTAYLKAHYPKEFFTALLTSVSGNEDREEVYIKEAESMGIKILPPDINKSDIYFKIEGDAIRFGFSAIKNVGENAAKIIVEEREKGEYRSFYDFLTRCKSGKINKKVIESLIKAGAFDSLNPDRALLLEELKGNEKKKPMLFSEPVKKKKVSKGKIFDWEKEAFGFYFSGHPLKNYIERMRKNEIKISSLSEIESGSNVKLLGAITSFRHYKTKRGDVVLKFVLEDESGKISIVAFNPVASEVENHLRKEGIIRIEGEYRIENDRVSVRVLKVLEFLTKRELEEKLKDVEKRGFHLYLKLKRKNINDEFLRSLHEFFERHKGNDPVTMYLVLNGKRLEMELEREHFIKVTPKVITELKKLIGEENFWYKEEIFA
ncbi:MAG TPA: DNA polymerase III subunit alpha [Firmicutes bacterium]|nr:DNA polymerase III subunit alpha [Bacillota bacterium]